MTKKDYFNLIKDVMADNADVVAFCDKEIALLDKKASKAKTAPKKADALLDVVLGAVTADAQTIDSIAAAVGISNAKTQARLRKLVDDGKVVKGSVRIDKHKKVTYALAA